MFCDFCLIITGDDEGTAEDAALILGLRQPYVAIIIVLVIVSLAVITVVTIIILVVAFTILVNQSVLLLLFIG